MNLVTLLAYKVKLHAQILVLLCSCMFFPLLWRLSLTVILNIMICEYGNATKAVEMYQAMCLIHRGESTNFGVSEMVLYWTYGNERPF